MTHKLNFVSCVAWIRQGVAKELPNRCQLTQEEIRSKIESDRQKFKELKRSDPNNRMETDDQNDDDQQIIDRYNLDDYDDDGDDDDFLIPDDTASDPYLNRDQNYSDDEEEKDDFRIKPTDNLLLAGHVEEDSVSLEIKVYNKEDGVYVHHEIYLAAYPLCFQWLNFKNENEKGNFVAIGDMNNDINIWDLDIVDILDPFAVLSGHKKSVLDISWSEKIPNMLASGSVDKKCLLWDLQQQTVIQTFDQFKSSVQSLSFHPIETNILLTGDAKGHAKLLNCQSLSIKDWNVCQDEIEKVIWNPQQPYMFLCATSDGWLYGLDSRNDNSHVFRIKAHDEMISGMEFSSANNGCLMTTSADQNVKIWSVSTNEMKLIQTIQPNIGIILSMSANPDHSNIFVISGNNVGENFKILDLDTYPGVKRHFNLN